MLHMGGLLAIAGVSLLLVAPGKPGGAGRKKASAVMWTIACPPSSLLLVLIIYFIYLRSPGAAAHWQIYLLLASVFNLKRIIASNK